MRKHEIELISALVEGRLEDESEARALIASSVELQAEYESQKKARQALAAAGPALMREDEKATLNREVWTALRAQTTPTRVPWYYRWVPITAGLFVIVVVGAVIVAQGDNAEFEATGAVADSFTTSMASTATTEAATATMTEEMSDAEAAPAAGELDSRAFDQLDARLFTETAKALREEGADLGLVAPSVALPAIDLDECLDEAGLDDVDILGTIDSASLAETSGIPVPEDVSTTFIVAVPAGDDVQTAPISFVDAEACQEVYVDQ